MPIINSIWLQIPAINTAKFHKLMAIYRNTGHLGTVSREVCELLVTAIGQTH
jgi:hypothetical protein